MWSTWVIKNDLLQVVTAVPTISPTLVGAIREDVSQVTHGFILYDHCW